MRLKILFLEPFYGGSHKEFADGFAGNSRHDVDLVTLPARFWKWRMRGASLYFARRVPDPEKYDLVFATDLMGLADLYALWKDSCPPIVLYLHENQLSYPLPQGEQMDYHFGFTDITSCLTADRIIFNSWFHLNSFFDELPRFIRKMPEYRPVWVPELLREKSSVVYPGCSFPDMLPSPAAREPSAKTGKPPLIVWNHRWEFDKNPELFFSVLYRAQDRGLAFRAALLGENFQMVPKPFLEARERLRPRIIRYGYVEDREEYFSILSEGDLVISTSIQENFGYSFIEAVHAGCYPILPYRLSYPEIIPQEFHGRVLYTDNEELEEKVCSLLTDPPVPKLETLSAAMEKFSWRDIGTVYDDLLEKTAREGRNGKTEQGT